VRENKLQNISVSKSCPEKIHTHQKKRRKPSKIRFAMPTQEERNQFMELPSWINKGK